MRVTDDRYTQQRFRLEVALKLIRHEARTSTIREATGLSEDRIRKLHRTYIRDSFVLRRRRGRSPQQTHCLTHNLATRIDASLMAGVLTTTGLLEQMRQASRPWTTDTYLAARMCDAYDLFSRLRTRERCDDFSFEHAWFLGKALVEGTELTLGCCPLCTGTMLKDVYDPRAVACPLCEARKLLEPRVAAKRRRGKAGAAARSSAVDGVSGCISIDGRRSQ